MYVLSEKAYIKLRELAGVVDEDDFDPWNANGEESYFMGTCEGRQGLASEILKEVQEFK